MSSTLLLVIFFGMLVGVYSWGLVGHRMIARLAQSELTDTTSDWIQDLIPWHWNGNMSAMASWADDILHSNTNPTDYPNWQWSQTLHYINIPDWNCNYLVERDCINDICVDGAIRNYSKRLQTDLDDIQHREALYFLIHYVGDIHQPLHVAFSGDYGGNTVRGRFMNISGEKNLHSLWDSGIIDYRMKQDFYSDFDLYYNYIYQIMINQIPLNNDNDIEQWIKEGIDFLCQQIYFDDKNHLMNSSVKFNLGEIYYRRSITIIEQRLAQGGRRLGALLNRLEQYRPIKTITHQLCPGTYILILVLFIELIIGIILGISLFIRHKIKHRQ